MLAVLSFNLVLREVRVPRGKEHGRDGVRHDVRGLVREELLDAHGSDGDGSAHLVPDLFFFRTAKHGGAERERNTMLHLESNRAFIGAKQGGIRRC